MNQPSTIFSVDDAKEADLVDVDLLSGRRNAEEVAGVRRLEPPQHADAVVFRDDVLDHVDAVGKRLAQEESRFGKVLSVRIRRRD